MEYVNSSNVAHLHKNESEFRKDTLLDANNSKWVINSYQNDILTAGCHTIPYSEMQETAVKLNLAS